MSTEPARPATAVRLDHYRLEKRLALGGMAEIFLAVDEKSGQRVALKRILPQVATDKDFLDRFFHEIQIQISLKHKNIVELLDCSPAPSNAYIVMEYVDGGSLQNLREDVGSFPWELAIYVASETLKGLAVAHRKGITHRDVKPHNVMWTTAGVVKIADFGISQSAALTRLTMTGTVVGTPAHMSPEQARGESLDGRSDLFSMGTVLYELLTNVNPFVGDSVTSTLRRVVDVDPDPPSLLDPTIPPSVDLVMRRLHAKDREQRFATAEEAIDAMRACLEEEGLLQVGGIFRSFLSDPKAFVTERKQRLARESASATERLLSDQNAAPEEALWSAYRTLSCAPNDASAQTLFRTASERAGQREKPVDNARIRDLEIQLRKDPGNVGLMLQLAKLYRLEHDFINVMRFFRRLQAVAPGDAYTQGQISALVGAGPGTTVSPRAHSGSRLAVRHVLPETADDEAPGRGARGLVIAGALVLVAACVWWAMRPRVDFRKGSGVDGERIRKVTELLKGGAPLPVIPPHDIGRKSSETLQQILEKGALVEKEHGPARALEFYREQLADIRDPDVRGPLLLTIADDAARAGDDPAAMAALDEVIALGNGLKNTALLRKAEALERRRDDAGARSIYEALVAGNDTDARRRATLRLAIGAERAGDPARALTLYQEILARSPESEEANPARLGAAAIYRATDRKADARRMYEEIKKRSPPGSDFAGSADSGLQSLE
ncbi:MAG: protein kinase [Thermoanaerobaculia bacterium]